MLICGLKLTHDGAIALIEDDRLVFSIEMEKLANNHRYSPIRDLATVSALLEEHGCPPAEIDRFVIDGWEGLTPSVLDLVEGGEPRRIQLAPYREDSLKSNVLKRYSWDGLQLAGASHGYTSFTHAAGHLVGAWCTSPFAERGEDAFVLVWDGGMYPRLYHLDAAAGEVSNLGPLFLLIGHSYSVFAQYFGPFDRGQEVVDDDLSVAGKVMAYIAFGTAQDEVLAMFRDVYRSSFEPSMSFIGKFARECKVRAKGRFSDEDVLASFHVFLEQLLVDKLRKKIAQSPFAGVRNLCFVGGCALNIKWNSALRRSGLFEHVWVPPFPNDAGSALGTACCALLEEHGFGSLHWDVYAGPALVASEAAGSWHGVRCSLDDLAEFFANEDEPVVFLQGRAELGPRALGNRSILAPADRPEMKGRLNKIKKREAYRPVAPICLEDRAAKVFEPGSPDPYMLFDHQVRSAWRRKVPAILHLDGSARLQTVNAQQNPAIATLLEAYQRRTGIPLLCNTSANLNGSGFFPDLRSATEWGKTKYVWCEGTLYHRVELGSDGEEVPVAAGEGTRRRSG